MGLDAVELVMATEEAFDIQITDAEAESLVTPGQLIDFVMARVGRDGPAVCLSQRAFHRLRKALLRQLPVKRREVRPDTPVDRVLPRRQRARVLRKLMDDLGIHDVPELGRSPAVQTGIAAFAAGTGIAVAIMGDPLAPVGAWIAGFLAALVAGVATHGLRLEFRPAQATVGGLARWVLARRPDLVGAPPGPWTRSQVAAKVRELTVDRLGCGKTYREDARFVDDLGME